MHNEYDLMREFDDFLDECYDSVEILGMEFLPNQILKTDQIAYRGCFLDWCSANDYDF